MLSLIIQTVKKRRNLLLSCTAIAVSFVWMMVAVFPSFSGKAEQMTKAFENYPDAMLKAFNIEMDSFLTSLEGFLAGENFSIMWPIILIVLALAFASSTIAGEIDRGTIEILLAQPISRIKIFLSKYFAGLIMLLIFVFASVFSAVPLALLYNVDFNLQSYLAISILGTLFGFSILGISIMFSSIFSEGGKASSAVGGILILMYALNIIAAFKESLGNLKYFSFFYYFDHNAAMLHNQIDAAAAIVFLSVGIVCASIGAVAFVKRDIAV